MIAKSKVKEEILENILSEEDFDYGAYLYSVILFFGSLTLSERKLYLSVEAGENTILLKFSEALKTVYGINATLSVSQHTKKTLKQIELSDKDTLFLLDDLSAAVVEDGRLIGFTDKLCEKYRNERAFKTVMQTAFLKNGALRIPDEKGEESGYYAEVVFENDGFAAGVAEELETYGIKAKLAERNETYAVYLKDGESVGAFLALVRAYGSALELQEILLVREERNNSNRRANCDSHNTDKTALASVKQVLAITKIQQSAGGLAALPTELYETALCRLNNNTASTEELAVLLNVSKGCVQHRLKKLCDISDGLNI
ncbi:MAG: DNA-binding protein WhiA [Clostridiales bacterium]|jgi:DNA-binding protein WhiA|nr:DNA-binding protein WhiA [Clostridiales bacterium]